MQHLVGMIHDSEHSGPTARMGWTYHVGDPIMETQDLAGYYACNAIEVDALNRAIASNTALPLPGFGYERHRYRTRVIWERRKKRSTSDPQE